MTHKMRLVDFAFKKIKNEVDTSEILKVVNLYKCKTFKELFDKFQHKRFGLNESDTEEIMDNFYTKEEQERYGALGIEIKLIENE